MTKTWLKEPQVATGVVYCDFDTMVWRVDLFALQVGLSVDGKGIDAYFEWLQLALPLEVKECIGVGTFHLSFRFKKG